MTQFANKAVIVTGASSGIGRAAALQFAKAGAKVVLADVNQAGLNDTHQQILSQGGDALISLTDVADAVACQAMVDACVTTYGRLDVLFNNAGIAGERALTESMSLEAWHKVIDINLNGVFYCTRAALPAMTQSGGGVIVNTASVDGLVGMGSLCHYTAAKHAVIGLTKTTALEYASKNIRAVAVCPGYIVTNMTETSFVDGEKELFQSMVPMGRGATPEEVANFVTWVSSDQASYINGSFHQVDGGLLAGFGATA